MSAVYKESETKFPIRVSFYCQAIFNYLHNCILCNSHEISTLCSLQVLCFYLSSLFLWVNSSWYKLHWPPSVIFYIQHKIKSESVINISEKSKDFLCLVSQLITTCEWCVGHSTLEGEVPAARPDRSTQGRALSTHGAVGWAGFRTCLQQSGGEKKALAWESNPNSPGIQSVD
jgi:hypothetical protein